MDRPRQGRRNTFATRLKRNVLIAVGLFAVVFGVGMITVAFIYFLGDWDGQANSAGDGGRPAAGSASSQTAKQSLPQQNRLVAFVNVNLVPMDSERIVAAQTVIVRDGRIAEIGAVGKTEVPAAALRIEGRGKYLMPGLADMHVHLRNYTEEETATLLQLYALNGVTTILNLSGTPRHLQLRERVAKGALFGPTIYTSGPFISAATGAGPTPEEVERAVVEQKQAGYDLIKIHGDFSREAYRKLFEIARREGRRVVGHSPRNLGYEVMIEERQDAVAHAEEYIYDKNSSSKNFAALEPKIPALAQATAQAGTWLIPNLTAYKNIGLQVHDIAAVIARAEMRYMPARIAASWGPDTNPYVARFDKNMYEGFMARYRVLEKLTKGFHGAGVRLLAGTDAMNPSVVPGFSLRDELRDLVAAGLTPYEAIKTATANPAEFLGAAREFGTIAVGKRADLILVENNPLQDVTNAGKRAGVMIGGRWLGEADIRRMFDDLAAAHARK